MGLSGGGCMVFGCLSLILMIYILPFAALSLAAVGGSQVKASIGALFVPAIYKTDSAGYTLINSTSIFFRLLLRDDAYQMGVYYNDLILKFSHLENKTSAVPIATYTLPGFYQKGNDHGSTIDRSDYVEAAGFSWEEASRNVSEVVLRVDLATAVRFKYAWWKSKRHTILAQSDVKVSTTTGNKVAQKDIRLRSSTQHHSGVHYKGFIAFSLAFYILVSIVWFISIFFTCRDD
ncbi:protein NDR1-like [Apium graveolens]|uniref:protein NDR1-like n=1 Tax=Apium graveolens TaxID=4045 RepID=UPI003D7A31C3